MSRSLFELMAPEPNWNRKPEPLFQELKAEPELLEPFPGTEGEQNSSLLLELFRETLY